MLFFYTFASGILINNQGLGQGAIIKGFANLTACCFLIYKSVIDCSYSFKQYLLAR